MSRGEPIDLRSILPGLDDEPDEWGELRSALRRILDDQAPMDQVRAWDEKHEFPFRLYRLLAESGYIAMPFDESVGGAGAGPQEMVVVAEELGRRGMDIAAGYGISVFLGLTIQRHGTQELRDRLLPSVLAGDRRISVSITEPNAGSDAASISTRATRVGDGYRLTGQKVFTTGAGLPDASLAVAAKSDHDTAKNAVSMFVIDADAPGVTVRRLNTVGRHILGTYEVFLDDVAVDEAARLGPEGGGWEVLRSGLTMERLFSCGAYVGALTTVLDLGMRYTSEREQFGQKIVDFQAVSHPLADIYANLAASRLLTYSAARRLTAGKDARRDISVAKLFASEAYQQATGHVMQSFGGYGYMCEYDIERYWRDARIATVTAGTSQIQREIILRSLGLR